MRFAFLGPVGTYGEQAARQLAELEEVAKPELVPQSGIRAVVQALAHGSCDAAVVPVENSVEGGVTSCLDSLWEHPDLTVARALVLPIRHALLGSGPIEGVSEVLSHPQALAQCSQWLADHLPRALQLPTSSTSQTFHSSFLTTTCKNCCSIYVFICCNLNFNYPMATIYFLFQFNSINIDCCKNSNKTCSY